MTVTAMKYAVAAQDKDLKVLQVAIAVANLSKQTPLFC